MFSFVPLLRVSSFSCMSVIKNVTSARCLFLIATSKGVWPLRFLRRSREFFGKLSSIWKTPICPYAAATCKAVSPSSSWMDSKFMKSSDSRRFTSSKILTMPPRVFFESATKAASCKNIRPFLSCF